MFEPRQGPRVFGAPPGAEFPRVVADGLVRLSAGGPPESLAQVRVIANSGRMRRLIREAFDRHAPLLAPRIDTLDGAGAERGEGGALRRRLELAQLVSALIEQSPGIAPPSAAFDLADSLAALADEMLIEDVDPSALDAIDAGDHAEHWERSLRFLQVLRPFFAATSAATPAARTRTAIDTLLSEWSARPPQRPVIVAGSTGSRGATLSLMEAVARLPQGAVILPGFDFDQPASVWDNLSNSKPEAEDHPQYRFARLLQRLGVAPSDVLPWPGAAGPSPARNRLISLALRPAPVTHQWRTEGGALGDLGEPAREMTLIEAPSPRIEATAIAMRIRLAVEDGQVAALVTPDRDLSRRVAATLDRWGIVPDDSAGRPLGLTAPGRLLRHVAALFDRPLTVEALLVILKHPLVNVGDRGAHLLRTRELELRLRAKGPPFPTADDLRDWRDDAWTDWVARTVFPPPLARRTPLRERVERHVAIAEALAAGPDGGGSGELWNEEPGRRAREAMDLLLREADAGGAFSAPEYEALLAAHLTGEVREATGPHPLVLFRGALEARAGGADLVILGGLNEGIWPAQPSPDPWLNRTMRAELGLLSPERQIGLSAHDFQQAVAAREVMLTRSVRDAEAETVPSRWLNRLVNLMNGLKRGGGPEALAQMRLRGNGWIRAAEGLGQMAEVDPAPRPSPRPPVSARPRRLSVTAISKLVRDPYAIYAEHVLELRPLAPLRAEPDAPLRGQFLHRVVERFVRDGPYPDEAAAASRLVEIADGTLAEDVPYPVARRLWRGRIAGWALWIAREEARRREIGTPAVLEERREWSVPGMDFQLVGVPDRVDRLTAGGYAVLDYKTGAVPSPDQIEHYDRQLLLLAAMVEHGAFPELEPGVVAEVAHVSLGARPKEASYALPYASKTATFDVAGTVAGLMELIANYDRRSTGYTARRAAHLTSFAGDYDHLARFGEWDEGASTSPEDVG